MVKFKFKKEDYILYILSRIEPEKSDKIKLNKVAFFVEFAYIYHNKNELSDTKYAAITQGAVIDKYDQLLKDMENKNKIKVDKYIVRPLENPHSEVPQGVSNIIDPLIKKYSLMSNDELIVLCHSTDSYKITTDNERFMGRVIDKELAVLESFFDEDTKDDEIPEDKLPKLNREILVEYEFK